MITLDETTEVEQLGEAAKAERDAFEAARREVKSWDQKSAVHYYRLGNALALGKAKLGRGLGKAGRFRAWHVGLGIDQNLASRAMRLYEAALDDGGEEALAGMGWWASLKHYGIVSDDKGAGQQGERPNYWTSPGGQHITREDEVGYESENPASDATMALPTFNDIALFGGFRKFLTRHLVALGASEDQAEAILKEEYEAIHDSLMMELKERLSSLVQAEAM